MAFMYCKLFASLYQGTLRGKANEILVFTNLLAHADKEGYVDKHFRAIADEVGLSIEDVNAAIVVLESPDNESRSPELDGRRIVRINDHRAWGWHIVNYGKYRSIKNDEDRREQNRAAQERWRNKHQVSSGKQRKPKERDKEKERQKEIHTPPPAPPLCDFDQFWKAYPKKVAKAAAVKMWRKVLPTELGPILAALAEFRESDDWIRDDGKWIPHPATWLNERRWEDEGVVPVVVEPTTPSEPQPEYDPDWLYKQMLANKAKAEQREREAQGIEPDPSEIEPLAEGEIF